MALDSYTGLRAEVLVKLMRDSDTDAVTRFDAWLALFEAKARRMLRAGIGEVRSRYTGIDSEYTALPSDFIKVRAARRIATGETIPLEPMPPMTADSYLGGQRGEPKYYLIEGDSLRLVPAPSSSVTIELVYYALPALTASAPTNWLLNKASDIYYSGVLAEACKYYEDAANTALHLSERDAGISDLNRAHSFQTLGSGLAVRPNTQTP